MQTPTTAQLRTAIEVLTKLGERLNTEAAYSVVQMPESSLGAYYARSIEARAIEQTIRIENVSLQLQTWRDELREQNSQGAGARQNFKIRAANAWCWIKNLTMSKCRHTPMNLGQNRILKFR